MLEERYLKETVLILRGSRYQSLVKKLFELSKRYYRLQKQFNQRAEFYDNKRGEQMLTLQVFIDYCNQLSRLQRAIGERNKWRTALRNDYRLFEEFAKYLASIYL